MRKVRNTRIFTWKTLCPTKVKTHDLPPVGFFSLHYHGQIGYNVTHSVTSNPHNMSNTYGHTHHTSLSHLDSNKTLTLQKNENFLLITPLLTQANVRYNESSEILPKLNNFNHTHKIYSVFSL